MCSQVGNGRSCHLCKRPPPFSNRRLTDSTAGWRSGRIGDACFPRSCGRAWVRRRLPDARFEGEGSRRVTASVTTHPLLYGRLGAPMNSNMLYTGDGAASEDCHLQRERRRWAGPCCCAGYKRQSLTSCVSRRGRTQGALSGAIFAQQFFGLAGKWIRQTSAPRWCARVTEEEFGRNR